MLPSWVRERMRVVTFINFIKDINRKKCVLAVCSGGGGCWWEDCAPFGVAPWVPLTGKCTLYRPVWHFIEGNVIGEILLKLKMFDALKYSLVDQIYILLKIPALIDFKHPFHVHILKKCQLIFRPFLTHTLTHTTLTNCCHLEIFPSPIHCLSRIWRIDIATTSDPIQQQRWHDNGEDLPRQGETAAGHARSQTTTANNRSAVPASLIKKSSQQNGSFVGCQYGEYLHDGLFSSGDVHH